MVDIVIIVRRFTYWFDCYFCLFDFFGHFLDDSLICVISWLISGLTDYYFINWLLFDLKIYLLNGWYLFRLVTNHYFINL